MKKKWLIIMLGVLLALIIFVLVPLGSREVVCPNCHGKDMGCAQVEVIQPDGTHEQGEIQIKCMICDSKGKVSEFESLKFRILRFLEK